MAHYVASINIFEHELQASASIKVFRVFDFGAKPTRPVWQRQVLLEKPESYRPQEWLQEALRALLLEE